MEQLARYWKNDFKKSKIHIQYLYLCAIWGGKSFFIAGGIGILRVEMSKFSIFKLFLGIYKTPFADFDDLNSSLSFWNHLLYLRYKYMTREFYQAI